MSAPSWTWATHGRPLDKGSVPTAAVLAAREMASPAAHAQQLLGSRAPMSCQPVPLICCHAFQLAMYMFTWPNWVCHQPVIRTVLGPQ